VIAYLAIISLIIKYVYQDVNKINNTMDPNAYARQDTGYSRMYALNAQVMDKE
jgi:hypothetical protein